MSANGAPGFKQRPDYRIATKPAGTRVQVKFNGEVVADSRDAVEMKEGGDGVVLLVEERSGERGLVL